MIISSPSAAAAAVMMSSCLPRSWAARPADHVYHQEHDGDAQPGVGGSRRRGPEQMRQDDRQQRNVGGRDHRPGGGQGCADLRPRWQVPALQLAAQKFSVFLGEPVHASVTSMETVRGSV